MPNTTGGKNYKKSKHSNGTFAPAFIDRQPDQIYARVIKNLGNRNLLAYCNDNKTRLCHIRGAMRKKVWVNLGDLVLISLREFEKEPDVTDKTYEKGDIVAKYDAEHLSKLKKMPDINKKLFMQLETADGAVLSELGKRDLGEEENEDGIEFDYDTKKEDDGNGNENNNEDVDIDDI